MSISRPSTVEMSPLSSSAQAVPVSQSSSPPASLSIPAPPPSAAAASRWHSRPAYLSIMMLQLTAALAVAAFAVVVAGWVSRPSWTWSFLTWYFFALGGLQFVSILFAAGSVAKQSKVVLIGSLFFFAIGTIAVIVTGLLMLIPAFRSSFFDACFTPFVSADFQATMLLFEQQYCVTATGNASDFGKWAAWCLALVGTFIQLPWILYTIFHFSVAKVADNTLAFNKLPLLPSSIPLTVAPTVSIAKDTSAGCGILFAPTNQNGTLQVP